MIQLSVNNKPVSIDAAGDTPLLWALREKLDLTGTKFGCGMAQCGACTVHVNGEPVRACVTPIASVAGKKITTIEGLVQTKTGKALEAAWIEAQAPQCGYCQSGQMMTAASVVTKSIKKAGNYTGFFPLDDNLNWEKNAVTLKQLHGLRERIKQLETQLKDI